MNGSKIKTQNKQSLTKKDLNITNHFKRTNSREGEK